MLIIVAAAVKSNGLIMSMPAPARHEDIIKRMPGKAAKNLKPSDQGFLDNTGNFVSRTDALIIARIAKQLLKDSNHKELFSEDLW